MRTEILSSKFAALGDPTRFAIIESLAKSSPQPLKSLTHEFDMTRQAVSKHLSVLEGAGLVASKKSGRMAIYALKDGALPPMQAWLQEIESAWAGSLSRLQIAAESLET